MTNWYWLCSSGRRCGDSAPATMKLLMPAMRAESRRRSASTFCSAGRWSRGLSSTNKRPLLSVLARALLPPTIEATLATCGERRMTVSATCCCSATMAGNEMSCRASVETESWPMSSCGKKPLGMSRNSQTVQADGGEEQHQHQRLCAQAEVQRPGRSRAGRGRSRARTGCAAAAAASCSAGRIWAQSIGVSVSETKAEATIAIVTTIANSLKMRPTTPPISRTGMNTATSETVIEMMVKPISRLPLSAASNRRHALLDVADDVLQHDDGVVDDQADRERQRQQRDVVDRVAEQIHRAERGDQRDRHGERRDDGGAEPRRGTGRSPG